VPGEKRRLPIIIGGFEAQAIAIELEKMKPTRPLTHDLFLNFANHFNIHIKEVVINKFEEGIFFSQLVCVSNGHTTLIDSRTSDAVALAIRFKCPIYAFESIVDEAGIVMEEGQDEGIEESKDTKTSEKPEPGKFEEFLTEELEEKLKKAVAEENYEEASRLRDEINKRKKKKK
jgi:bifunctional DNase/RNase